MGTPSIDRNLLESSPPRLDGAELDKQLDELGSQEFENRIVA
jgi:hypothetical protein